MFPGGEKGSGRKQGIESKQTGSAALMYANGQSSGQIDRREFQTRATDLGLTAAAAYELIGVAMPTSTSA